MVDKRPRPKSPANALPVCMKAVKIRIAIHSVDTGRLPCPGAGDCVPFGRDTNAANNMGPPSSPVCVHGWRRSTSLMTHCHVWGLVPIGSFCPLLLDVRVTPTSSRKQDTVPPRLPEHCRAQGYSIFKQMQTKRGNGVQGTEITTCAAALLQLGPAKLV